MPLPRTYRYRKGEDVIQQHLERYAALLLDHGGTDIVANGEVDRLRSWIEILYGMAGRPIDFWTYRSTQNVGTGTMLFSFHGHPGRLHGAVVWGPDGLSVPTTNLNFGVRIDNNYNSPPRLFHTSLAIAERTTAIPNCPCPIHVAGRAQQERKTLIVGSYQLVRRDERRDFEISVPMMQDTVGLKSVEAPGDGDYFQDLGYTIEDGVFHAIERKTTRTTHVYDEELLYANQVVLMNSTLASGNGSASRHAFLMFTEHGFTVDEYSQLVDAYYATIGHGLTKYF